eukprot:PhF_6_TR1508/c0_g1_i1/m.2739
MNVALGINTLYAKFPNVKNFLDVTMYARSLAVSTILPCVHIHVNKNCFVNIRVGGNVGNAVVEPGRNTCPPARHAIENVRTSAVTILDRIRVSHAQSAK